MQSVREPASGRPLFEGLESRLLMSVSGNESPIIVYFAGDADVDEGYPASFTADAFDPDGDDLSFTWYFGDGSPTANGVEVDHVYADNGDYPVTLTVSDGNGGSSGESMLLTILNVAPIADAGDDVQAEEWDTISFTGTCTDAGTADTHRYLWEFGDGTIAIGQTSAHAYADNGIYTATLTVLDDDGDVGVDALTVTVRNAPPVILDMSGDTDIDEGDTGNFSASASDAGFELTYAWNFGDGGEPAVGPSASHKYVDDGTYAVTLTVTDDDGDSSSETMSVTVHNVAPAVDAGEDQQVDTADAVDFAGVFTDAGVADTHSYLWDFGDGTTSTDLAAAHAYADEGVYTATLTVTDDDGGIGVDALTITVTADEAVPITFSRGNPARLTTSNGALVVVSLSGPGYGELCLADGTPYDIGPIVLSGTSTRSSLQIRAIGAPGADGAPDVAVGDIVVNGELGRIVAPKIDLTSTIYAAGRLGTILMDDAVGATIVLNGLRKPVRITFDRVADSVIESAAPIAVLKATEWLDTDDTPDLIRAPSMKRMVIGTRRGRSGAGDFQADLTLTGHRRWSPALGWASIGGDLTGSSWNITGSLVSLIVGGTARQSKVRTTGSMVRLTLGAADGSDFLAGMASNAGRHAHKRDDFVDPFARIMGINIRGTDRDGAGSDRFLVDSNFSAARIGRVNLRNMNRNNGGREFGLFARYTARGAPITAVKYADTATGEKWSWGGRSRTQPIEGLRNGDFVMSILAR